MKVRSVFSALSGFAIGFGIIVSMTFMLEIFGVYGWLLLPVILALAVFLGFLAICLPYYFEERQIFKQYEKRNTTK